MGMHTILVDGVRDSANFTAEQMFSLDLGYGFEFTTCSGMVVNSSYVELVPIGN